MTDGGWHSMAAVARLYGKSWKWVQNQVKRYNISTETRGNQRVLRLVDFIPQVGEPPANGTETADVSHTDQSETVTSESQGEAALLKQENAFLRRRIEDLEADKADWKAERSKLQGIIEKQTLALPKPEEKGVWSRFLEAFRAGV